MRRFLFFLLAFIPFFFSCSETNNNGGTEEFENCRPQSMILSDSLVKDTLSSQAMAISPDSVRLVVELFDAKGAPLKTPIPVTWEEDSYSETLMSDGNGMITRMVKRDHYVSLMYGEEPIMSYFDMKGGEVVNDHIQLNILPMKGRIMDNSGVPHQKMPIHIHYRFNRKDRSLACEKDQTFYTDSLGYYRTYVAAEFHSISLHTCGFPLGVISKKEFVEYPKQNFLFEPFEVENRCAYNVPRHDFFLEVPLSDGSTHEVRMRDWSKFFSLDETLENDETVKLKVIFDRRSYTYKLKKKNGLFRIPIIRVCIK